MDGVVHRVFASFFSRFWVGYRALQVKKKPKEILGAPSKTVVYSMHRVQVRRHVTCMASSNTSAGNLNRSVSGSTVAEIVYAYCLLLLLLLLSAVRHHLVRR